jgi:hypothetical protein
MFSARLVIATDMIDEFRGSSVVGKVKQPRLPVTLALNSMSNRSVEAQLPGMVDSERSTPIKLEQRRLQ